MDIIGRNLIYGFELSDYFFNWPFYLQEAIHIFWDTTSILQNEQRFESKTTYYKL